MNAPALDELLNPFVRCFDEAYRYPQTLAGQGAESMGEATLQFLVLDLDLGHAIGHGEPPTQLLRGAPRAPATKQQDWQYTQRDTPAASFE
jgi:hypothetical protein